MLLFQECFITWPQSTPFPSPVSHSPTQSQQTPMYSQPNMFGYFDPANYPQNTYNPGNAQFYPTNMPSRRPQSSKPILPDAILFRVLSHCDEEAQLEAALVCRDWLRISRRVYFSSYTIQSSADYRLLLLFLQPGCSVHGDYVKRLDVSFISDDSKVGSTSAYRRAPSHVSVSDIHQLTLQLHSLESLRADWTGARASSALKVVTSSPVHVPSQSIPSFLTIPHVLQRLRHLEVRGGSWPVDSLLQSLAYMSQLTSLSLENIYESTAVAIFLPHLAPTFYLVQLVLQRCTFSGESMNWLLSTSHRSLRHLTTNSLRKRPGSGSFASMMAMAGPSLETLRVRNCIELPRWDSDSLLRVGLGYCPNIKTLVVWCDSPQTSPYSVGAAGGSPSISQYSPALPLRAGVSDSRPPSRNHPYPQAGRGFTHPNSPEFALDGFQSPGSPSTGSASLPSVSTQPPPGALLPILTTFIQQGWLPRLNRLVIPASQIDGCPTRVECQAELLLRGITLGDNWAAM